MDNYFKVSDYLNGLEELKDPNTIESKCMIELSKISNTELLEEVLSAIVDNILSFSDIWKLPSITTKNVEMLLNSKSPVFIINTKVNEFVDNQNIWAYITSNLMNADYRNQAKYYTIINLPTSKFLVNASAVILNSSVSIGVHKNTILEYFNDETIKQKYLPFSISIPNATFNSYINEISVKTANLMFGNIANTNLNAYNYMRYSLVDLIPQNIIFAKTITWIIDQIKSKLFDRMLSLPVANFNNNILPQYKEVLKELANIEVGLFLDGDIFKWAQQYQILQTLMGQYSISNTKKAINDNVLVAVKLFSTTYNNDLVLADSTLV